MNNIFKLCTSNDRSLGYRIEYMLCHRANFGTFSRSEFWSTLLAGVSDVASSEIEAILFFNLQEKKRWSFIQRTQIQAVVFEPGRFLPSRLYGQVPQLVPAEDPELLGTAFGLLTNELARSPEATIDAVLQLLEQAGN